MKTKHLVLLLLLLALLLPMPGDLFGQEAPGHPFGQEAIGSASHHPLSFQMASTGAQSFTRAGIFSPSLGK